MITYVARRLLLVVPTLLVAGTVVFFIMRVVPGDPALVILGNNASAQALESLRARMGLTRPIEQQYLAFLWDLVRLHFGNSVITEMPIAPQIWRVFPFSVELMAGGMLIGLALGIPLGIVTATRRNTWLDYAGRVFALAGLSSPAFFLAVVLLFVFAVQLRWFPVIGAGEAGGGIVELLRHLFLPALTLGLIEAAFAMRLTRSALLEILYEQYVMTARAKGLRERGVLYRHALPNALIPIVTIVGIDMGSLLGGAILTETVFSRPGFARLLLGAIYQRDYNMIQWSIIFFALLVMVINLLVDITYGLIDPRIRYE